MSAIFMGHHRFSNINPEDIARFGGGGRVSLNSISFRSDRGAAEDDEDLEDEEYIDEEDMDAIEEIEGVANAEELFQSEDADKPIDDKGSIGSDKPLDASPFSRKPTLRRSVKRGSSIRRKRTPWQRFYRRWQRIYRRFGLRHVIPVLLLVLYAIMGSLIFCAIEKPEADLKRQKRDVNLYDLRNITAQNITDTLGVRPDSKALEKIMTSLHGMQMHARALPQDDVLDWDFWGGLFYVGTLYTTIGYGNIVTTTTAGWALTMVYAFFGVPLVLAILSDIGHLLCVWSTKGWRKLTSRLPANTRKLTNYQCEAPPETADEPKEEEEPDAGMPVLLAIVLTIFWLLMCSGLFCIWETKWSYFTAFYFFFISLSTIGLGDVVPDRPMIMVLLSGLVIVGLCLVSMTIGVVQQHIEVFLYRMMKMLQKECEQLLANGEDVEKSELVKKMWEKQPWYLRKLMPALMGDTSNKRLQDFAGATITDTAVQMGLIEPPPGYYPGKRVPRAPPASHIIQPPPDPSSDTVPEFTYTAPKSALAPRSTKMPTEARLQPKGKVTTFLVPDTLAPEEVPHRKIQTARAQKLAPPPTFEELYPGGRVLLKRAQSTSSADRYKQLEQALSHRTMMTQTPPSLLIKPSTSEYVQTDLVGPDIVVKRETLSNLSLASWMEDEEALPLPMHPMNVFASEDLMQFRDLAGQLASSTTAMKTFADAGMQTDHLEDESSSSEEEFISAAETSTKLLRLHSKLVQTTRDDFLESMCNVEVQTVTRLHRNAEVQTSTPPRSHVETQCSPPSMVDEEMQTVAWQRLSIHQLRRRDGGWNSRERMDGDNSSDDFFDASPAVAAAVSAQIQAPSSRPDVLPNLLVDEAFSDKCTQTALTKERREAEMQTVAVRTRNLEMQTDIPSVQSTETQTSASRSSTPERQPRVRLSIDATPTMEDLTTIPVSASWSYNTWMADKPRQHLDSVPEAEDEEAENDYYDEEELEQDDDDNDATDVMDPHVYTTEDDSMSEGGLNLPAVTVASDGTMMTDDLGDVPPNLVNAAMETYGEHFGSVCTDASAQTELAPVQSIACQTVAKHKQIAKDLITAAIATQTEELVVRRNSFPRDIQGKRAEAIIRDYNNSKHKWVAWIGRRKAKEKERQLVSNTRTVAVQTEGYVGEGVRDIIVQTDDSYLKMARRLNALKTARTKSLAISIAPHLKQRLNRIAETSGASASNAPPSRYGAGAGAGKRY